MNAAPFDISRMQARLEKPLSLESLRPVGPGLARATQLLKIGGEVIARDEVLIEEVTYPLSDEMNAELNSMPIKMGMYSPFVKTSTYPPKYYFADRDTAWLVTSVPPVSLAIILDRLHQEFPPHYTWDRPAYVHDVAAALMAATACFWHGKRRPLQAVREARALLAGRLPQRITPRERMQLVALLVDAVRPRHAAGIYHNNITRDTVFFADCLSPRVLCNYGGVVPPSLDAVVPESLLHTSRAGSFGEQSVDTFCLALIAWEIITGCPFDGTRFQLDEPQKIGLPAWITRHAAGTPAFLAVLTDITGELYQSAAKLIDRVQSAFDNTRCRNLRTLTRASGSLPRSLPWLRQICDVWFPTETAVVLRSILDRTANDELFGPQSRINRGAKVRRNANLAYLRAVLPGQILPRRSRLARFVQGIIDEHQERGEYRPDEDLAPVRLGLTLKRPWLLRYAAGALFFVLLCAGAANHSTVNQPRMGAAAPGDTVVSGCRARFMPNRRYPGVYKLVDMRTRCRTAEIGFAAADDTGGQVPATLGQTCALLYLLERGDNGEWECVPVRRCPSETRGCEPGEFYRVAGLGGLAGRVRFGNGSVASFDRARLEEFVRDAPMVEQGAAPTAARDGAGR